MKKLLSALFSLALCFALLIRPSAETAVTAGGMTARLSDVFTVFTAENIDGQSGRAAELSEDFDSLKQKLSEGYLFYAIAPDMGWTAFMTEGETDISKTIENLADFSDEQTAEQALIGGVKDRASEIKEIRKGAALFLRLTFLKGENAENTDNRIVYITVINGKVYTLVFIEQSAELSTNAGEAADYIFNSLEYTVEAETARVKLHKQNTFNILLAVCAPVAAVAIFFILRSVKRDIIRAKQEENLRKNIKKKPRR